MKDLPLPPLALSGQELARATAGRWHPAPPAPQPSRLSTDSRRIQRGDLFVALKGYRFDGHDHLMEVESKGACGAVVSASALPTLPSTSLSLLVVEDTLRALGDMAAWVRRPFTGPVVAVTGSSGKTSVKEMIASILALQGGVLRTEANYNNLIGLPLTLLQLRPDHRAAVLEMGMNALGEIGRLTELAQPTVGLVTVVGPAHLEFLGSLEGVASAKGELFLGLGEEAVAVVNADDPLIQAPAQASRAQKVTFSAKGQADVVCRLEEILGVEGVRLALEVDGRGRSVVLRALGAHGAINAAAAAAAAWAAGARLDEIADGLAAYRPPSGRLSPLAGPSGLNILDDTYNANPQSTRAALTVLASLRKPGHAVAAALGEMRELGEAAGEAHREIGLLAAQMKLDLLLLLEPRVEEVEVGALMGGMAPERVVRMTDPAGLARLALEFLGEGDWLLIKGSRAAQTERIIWALEELGPRGPQAG